MERLVNLILTFIVMVCLTSCGGSSKSDVNVPTKYCEELVKLAEDGNAEAQANLAACYATGEGVTQSTEEAIKWLKKSVKQNNAKGQWYLGGIYEYGAQNGIPGIKKDHEEAMKWFVKAAKQGEPNAQFEIGHDFYQHGNYEEAFKWLKKSADQGHLNSVSLLGILYYYGKGVKQDKKKAIDLIKQAAEKGEPTALSALEIIKADY